jgi:hypothetical protein
MGTKPTTKTTPPPPVAERAALAEAEAAVADLEAQRRRQVEQQAEHDEERQRISYQAHVNHDVEARKRLSEMQDEAIRHTHSLKDIDAALVTAREKVALARAKLDRLLEQAKREQVAAELKKLQGVCQRLDEALSAFTIGGRDMVDIIDALYRLDHPHPNRTQIDALGFRALSTALAGSFWAGHFQRLQPAQRVTFAQLGEAWARRPADNKQTDEVAA